MSTGSTATVLLIEDNPNDVRLTTEAFSKGKLANKIVVVGDGVEAMAYLRREGKYADAPRPSIILLDLGLPRKDGREVLEEIKRDEDLKAIPVIVLTMSEAEEDVMSSYGLYANSFITKPANLDQFYKVVESIESYWLTVVQLPKGGSRRE